jgi:hypothetical protein
MYKGKKKKNAISVRRREGPQGCATPRLQNFVENRLTDGGEVSLTRRPPFTPCKIPGTPFCQRLSRPQRHSTAGSIRSIEKCKASTGIKPATFRLVA